MPYPRYATSDTIYSLNDDNWEVEIVRNSAVQSTNHKFEVGPSGVQLIYESEQDDVLLPGIVHSRCEVETIWTPDVATELDDMIEAMVDSSDGVWFMQVYRNGDRFWFGPILIDEVQLQETSAARSCRIVASDGISLLKTVDYNDNGSEYEDAQKIFNDVLVNIQEKWVSFDYVDSVTSGAERRIAVCDDMYSQDIWTVGTTPSGTDQRLASRMQLLPNMYSYINDEGDNEYVSCYDLLDSICKTLLWRLYYYDHGWWFIPCYNQESTLNGYALNWSGVIVSGVQLVDTFNYQVDTINNEIQKGNEWTHTFTAPINEVSITRDTNNGYIVLGETQIAGGSSLTSNTVQFTTSDSGYHLYGFCVVDRSALSPAAGYLSADRIGRYVLRLEIRFGTSAANYQYYQNTISPQAQGLFSWNMNFTTDGNSIVFTPLNIDEGVYNSGANYFYFHDTDEQNCLFDSNEANHSSIYFSINIPTVPVDIDSIQVTGDLRCYDRDGVFSQDLQDTIDTQSWAIYLTYGGDSVVQAPNFDIVANSTFGRGTIDLGKTYIGSLSQYVGGIMVETSSGVFQTSTNWSTQRYDYDDECNQTGVREVLAAHYKSRKVERGNIVMRGNGVAPAPFNMFVDDDTTDIYQSINYRLATTPAEVEVTLHKVGTDGQALTTTGTKDFGTSPIPNPGPGVGEGSTIGNVVKGETQYNNDAFSIFNETWTSTIGSETLESYYTMVLDGKGQYTEHQGERPPLGYDIQRKIYSNKDGFADSSNTHWAAVKSAYQPGLGDTLADAMKLCGLALGEDLTSTRNSFLITYNEVSSNLLDNYANAQVAFSLRKLRAAYTGAAIRVQNSGGTQADIGFDSNGDLDTASLALHVGSGTGLVVTWYDQSGNGRNATQATQSLLPRITISGTLQTANGKPAVYFDDDRLDTSAFSQNPNGAYNFAVVNQYDSVTSGMGTANSWSSTSTLQNYQHNLLSTSKLRFGVRYSDGAFPRPDSTGTFSNNTQIISTATFATGTCVAYYNGTQEGDKFSQGLTGTPNNNSQITRLGQMSHNGLLPLRGFIQEVIVWSNSTALDADAISTDINDYYGAF
jgi:hypothetical protein